MIALGYMDMHQIIRDSVEEYDPVYIEPCGWHRLKDFRLEFFITFSKLAFALVLDFINPISN